MDSLLLSIQRSNARGELYTFSLSVKWKDVDGGWVTQDVGENNVLPGEREVRAFKQSGESLAAAFRRITGDLIRGAIFRQIESVKSLRGGTDELVRRLSGASSDAVKKAVRAFKSRRGLRFKVVFQRVIA
jgi:hypothetical protein